MLNIVLGEIILQYRYWQKNVSFKGLLDYNEYRKSSFKRTMAIEVQHKSLFNQISGMTVKLYL